MDDCMLLKEIDTIRKAIEANLEGTIDDFSYINIGKFVRVPNQCGCFKREENWYIYETDEKNFCTFCGPFSSKGIIYACAMVLHISKNMKEYRFSEEEFNIYLNNHFHTFAEIDENAK